MRQVLFITGRKIEKELRDEFFWKLLLLPEDFYQKNKSGDLLSKAVYDMDSIRFLFGHIIMHLLNIISLYTFALISLLSINIPLTISAIIPFPLLFIISKMLSKTFFSHHKNVTTKMGELSTSIQEIFLSIAVIKTYVAEKNVLKRFQEANDNYVQSNMNLVKIRGFYHPLIALFAALSTVIILWYGGILVIEETISLGSFVAFNGTLIFLFRPTIFVGWVVNLFQRSKASLERIEEVINHTSGLIKDNDHTNHQITTLNGSIKINDLSFSYQERMPILKNINTSITEGESIAIIGEVGSGKSTLLKLMLRIYETPSNTILYDNNSLNNIPLTVFRENIGYISQEPIIFSGTIKDNIAYSDSDLNQTEIEEAAKLAGLKKDIEGFSDGYQTIVGENGITLSGGQKQRLAIARALIKRPKILFMDNAFSAIDTQTEEHIFKNLMKHKKDMTIVMIAHRISTLKHCNKILIIDNGTIVSQGSHEELLQNSQIYKEINEKQNK